MKNLFKKATYLAVLLFVNFTSNAQVTTDVPNYFPVSPNAASFAKQGLYPADYSTGKLNVGIPIYTIKTKELTVPISLSYNTSGIQLNETASWVGIGWNLNAGGAIVRNIKGRPDQGGVIPDLRGGLEFNEANYEKLCREERGEDDTAPDEFIISAPGLSGSFYFDHTDSYSVLFRDYQNTKVVALRDQSTQILSFTVTKDDGTVYVFGTNSNIETTTIADSEFSYLNYMTNSSYFLSEIISANGQERITFTYKTIDSHDYPVASSENLVPASQNSYIETNFPKRRASVKKKFLESIVFTNGKINFLSSLDRADLGEDYKLNSIEIYSTINNQNVLIQKNSLTYDYYIRSGGGTTSDPYSLDRLKNELLVQNSKVKSLRLKEVVDNTVNTKYSLEYNNTTLPARGSNAQDYWGYINNNSGSLIVPTVMDLHQQTGGTLLINFGTGNRNADETTMKAGILQKIIFPEGGYSTFEYEANKFTEDVNVPTLVQKSASVVAYGTGCNYNYGPSSNTSFFTVGSNYVQGSGKLNIFFSPASQESGGNTNVKFDTENFVRPLPFTIGGSSIVSKNFISGNHTLSSNEFRSGSVGAYGCPWTSIMASWQENNGFTIVPTVKLVGGLRIKSIKNFTGASLVPVTRKDYDYQQENVLVKAGVGSYKRNVIKVGSDQIIPICSSSSIFNNNIGGGPNITYGLVAEIEKDPATLAENGKIEYYFQNVAAERVIANIPIVFKHPSFIPYYPYSNINLQFCGLVDDFAYYKSDLWNYGSLLKTKIYKRDASNVIKLIKSTENQYSVLKTKTLPYNVVFNIYPDYSHPYYCEYTVIPQNGVYWQGGDFSSYQFFYFSGGVSVGKKVKTKTINTEYNASEIPTLVTTTDYYYDNSVHNQITRTETTNSKNEVLKMQLSYPQDLIASGQTTEMQKLTTQNRIDKPIKTETFLNNVQISETITKYEESTATGNLLLPKEIHSSKGAVEVFPFNYENRKINFTLYDTDLIAGTPVGNGNVLEYKIENGSPISIVWGYNKTQPIAKIENVAYSDVLSYVTKLQTLSNTGKEAELLSALATLRSSFSNAMITTYTYKPLIGVSTITDPKGNTNYYNYDEQNRLEIVKDIQGNILTQNQYHYKN